MHYISRVLLIFCRSMMSPPLLCHHRFSIESQTLHFEFHVLRRRKKRLLSTHQIENTVPSKTFYGALIGVYVYTASFFPIVIVFRDTRCIRSVQRICICFILLVVRQHIHDTMCFHCWNSIFRGWLWNEYERQLSVKILKYFMTEILCSKSFDWSEIDSKFLD